MYEVIDPSNSTAKWDDIKTRMTWLSFMPGPEGAEFWLVDIRLRGVAMRDLIVPWRGLADVVIKRSRGA